VTTPGGHLNSHGIRRIPARPLELPLAQPVRTAVGAMTSTPIVLIDVLCEDGAVGRSYVRTYTHLALGSLARLLHDLAPQLVGSAGPPAELIGALQGSFRLLGSRGLVGMALAGLDMALWDIAAQRAGVALADLLGSQVASVAAYRPLLATAAEAAHDEASRALGEGFDAVKVKVGHGALTDDLAVVSRLRAVLGPDRQLMVDYNQGLTVEEALQRGRALEEFGLGWIEEPIDAHDLLGYARLTQALSTPIGAGESLESVTEARNALDGKAVDVLTLDVARIGGITGWMQAAAHAAAAGIPVCSHAFPEFSVHLLAASPTGRWLEYHDYVAPILSRPLRIEAGRAQVPREPGVGLEWDERALRRFL
jgi:mandelate racemase